MDKKYRKEDKKKLIKEKRYEDIYNKYGEYEYDKLLIKAMYEEIKEEKGTLRAQLWKIKEQILFGIKKIGMYGGIALLSTSAVISSDIEGTKKENSIKYQNEIEEYNNKISDYANEINSMNLNDTQIFMKVMDDMWENIKGYGKPKKDILGFSELDLATEEGQGVCRNMASDVAKKLNEINPEYNARTMAVQLSDDGNFQIADIKRNILKEDQTIINEQEQTEENEDGIFDKVIENIVGNHAVTFVDLSKYNLTLVLDPTNPGIGIYHNGKIIMLNSEKEDDITMKAKEYTSAILLQGGTKGMANTISSYASSYIKPKLSFEEIESKFGLDAQNKALNEVRTMKLVNKNITEHQKFVDNIKISSSQEKIEEPTEKENNTDIEQGESR